MTGNELRRRREALGLSQARVAVLVDPDSNAAWRRGTVYRWERYGDRELPTAVGSLLEIRLGELERAKATA